MALIKCPECGQEVSSTAKHCVHCGFSFTVCPDCNAVLEGNTKVCPECGCVLKKDEPQTATAMQKPAGQESAVVTENAEVVSADWESRFAEQKRKEKIVKQVSRILGIVSSVLLLIGILVIYLWSEKEAAERMSSLKSLNGGIKFLIVFDCIIGSVRAIISGFDDALLAMFCRRKILNEKWDVKEYVCEHADDIVTDDAKKTFGAVITAAYWIDKPKACRQEFIKSVIAAALELAMVICAGVFLMQAVDTIDTITVLGDKFSWKALNYRPLIAAAVFLGAAIVNVIVFGVLEKDADAWVEEIKSGKLQK